MLLKLVNSKNSVTFAVSTVLVQYVFCTFLYLICMIKIWHLSGKLLAHTGQLPVLIYSFLLPVQM